MPRNNVEYEVDSFGKQVLTVIDLPSSRALERGNRMDESLQEISDTRKRIQGKDFLKNSLSSFLLSGRGIGDWYLSPDICISCNIGACRKVARSFWIALSLDSF